MQQLTPNTLLQGGKYKIEKVLGQGGFGITYLANHEMLDCKVAIKEFFFKEYCDRDSATQSVTIGTEGNKDIVKRFEQKFIKEAKTIFKLHHPNIIQIHDIFTENGTAYYVMEYIEGESLGDVVKRQGSFCEIEAIEYIRKVGNALSYIHGQNINHLDVKPGNIMLRRADNNAVLIDFGVAKQYDADTMEGTTTTPVGISHGYSPLEQYRSNGVQEFSPQSDVYALAATLFKLLTGVTPPEAIEVQEEGLPIEELKSRNVSEGTIKAIDDAMKSRKKRTQSIDQFLSGLDNLSSQTSNTSNFGSEETTIIHDVNGAKQDEVIIAKPTESRYDARQSVEDDNCSAKTFNVNGVIFKMIKVEGGTFDMKETVLSGFLGLSSKEIVQHTTLSDYWFGETQVTQALWQAVMGSNPSHFEGDNLPVESVSWNDCQKFIGKLNSMTGRTFRLPTEAQWEFAARGGNKSRGYEYSGSNDIGNVAWYDGNSGSKIHQVGTKQPNELGIYDMSGNVCEWCSDRYGEYSSTPQTNPTGALSGSYRINRGGGWCYNARFCRASYRRHVTPDDRNDYLGLRLAISEL